MSTKSQFDSLSDKKKSLGRVSIASPTVDALDYIVNNTEASKAAILEEALGKYGIEKKAASLKKEIEAQNSAE